VAHIMAARRRGIPSISIQHGLDCERGFHSEAYADAGAVWGPNRMERYRKHSVHQPAPMEVVGNPDYASLQKPTELDPRGDYWLWVTRPHSPIKCYPFAHQVLPPLPTC
jgi:hypothetical protein